MEKISSHLNRINHLSTIGFFLSLSLCILLACMSKLKMMRYKKKRPCGEKKLTSRFNR